MTGKYAWLRRPPVLVGGAIGLLIALAVYFLKDKFQKPPQPKKVIQQITMIQPAPPSPVEKTPEPEVEEKMVEEPEPEPEQIPEQEPEPAPSPEASNEQPAAELGLDADGSAGTDGFGLAAHKGGKPMLGGSGGGSMILWYGGQIKNQVEDGMQKHLADTVAMKSSYSVTIDVWVDSDGRITRTELSSGSGKADVDQAIRAALPKLQARVGKPPPEDMPQPVKIRLNSRA